MSNAELKRAVAIINDNFSNDELDSNHPLYVGKATVKKFLESKSFYWKDIKYGYRQEVVEQNGVRGIAGINDGIIISFRPVDEIKSYDLRMKVYKKKLGSVIK